MQVEKEQLADQELNGHRNRSPKVIVFLFQPGAFPSQAGDFLFSVTPQAASPPTLFCDGGRRA